MPDKKITVKSLNENRTKACLLLHGVIELLPPAKKNHPYRIEMNKTTGHTRCNRLPKRVNSNYYNLYIFPERAQIEKKCMDNEDIRRMLTQFDRLAIIINPEFKRGL